MNKTISPEEYAKLEGKKTLGWTPVYIGYKTKKERDYHECEDGHRHFLGWVERTYPIGEPISYEYHRPSSMEIMNYEWAEHALNNLMRSSNIVTNDHYSDGVKTIKFTRYSSL